MSVLVGTILCNSRTATADTAQTSRAIDVALAVRAPHECLTSAQVDAAVRQRSSRVHFLPGGEHTVDVTIRSESATAGSESWQANVEISRSGAREPARTLEAADCASLADAIGFIIALTFDPPSAETAAPAPPPAPPPEPHSQPVLIEDPVDRVDLTSISDEPITPARPEPPSSTTLHLAGTFEVVSEAGPLLLPGFGLGLQLASTPTSGVSFSPAGQVNVGVFPGRALDREAGAARFRLLVGRLSLCPLAVHEGVLTLRPCAVGMWGALDASGRATRNPENHTRPWGSLGGGLWAGVNASASVRIELDASFGATLVRDAFQFEPDVFYETPSVSARGSLGLSVLLP
jgi:hypothetical protein